MSVTYGFYNSIDGDRRYDAIQMSSIFDGILEDGVLENVGTAMMVTASGSDMSVRVGIGRAWFNHTWTLNDSILPLDIPGSDVLLPRIDAVVIEVDSRIDVRENTIKVVQGTAASSPSRPTLIKEDERWQYPLAYISVSAGATYIRQADITNMVGTSDCPFVTAPLEGISIDGLIAQWQDEWEKTFEEQTEDMEAINQYWKELWASWFVAQTTEIQDAYLEWEKQWQEWYASQTQDMEDTNAYWKQMWYDWFHDYTKIFTSEIEQVTSSLEQQVKDWLASLQELIDDDEAASLAQQMLELKEKMKFLENFAFDLGTQCEVKHPLEDTNYNTHDEILDSNEDQILDSDGDVILSRLYGNDSILDSNGDQIFGRFIYVIK